jgi:addiction module RelB/DinJ family antitoxin
MQRAVINVKVNQITKLKAKEVAADMGFSLSALVNAFLTQLVKTKTIEVKVDEVPTEFIKKILKTAREDRKKGKASPLFHSGEDAVEFLDQQRA